MALGLPLLPVCVMMVCLLGAARFSGADKITCPCSEIPQKDYTEPPSNTCSQNAERFRYTCVQGRVRKVGTSNLIKCKTENSVPQWTDATLQCIPDPKVPPTQPPETPATTGLTDIPHGSSITTTVTAASTSLQMTQTISISATATAETDGVEPTSPGLQVTTDHLKVLMETKRTDGTTSTSTTTETYNNSTADSHSSDRKLDSSARAAIVVALLVIVCALLGIGFFFYRRRSKGSIPQHTSEEQMPMNDKSPAAS